MSSKGNSSSSSGSGNSYTPYTVNNSGRNSQVRDLFLLFLSLPLQLNEFKGNNYDNRNQPSGNAYHYSNSGKHLP